MPTRKPVRPIWFTINSLMRKFDFPLICICAGMTAASAILYAIEGGFGWMGPALFCVVFLIQIAEAVADKRTRGSREEA